MKIQTHPALPRWHAAALLGLLVLGSLARAEPVLKAGDRVVLYGDSITEQRQYTRFIQQYIQCRYPELKVNFYNAGWSGDTAGGGFGRLERDVLLLKPTVVTLFFGMNDGGYRPMADGITSSFKRNEEKIITALKAKGIRVVVYTPGAVDYDRKTALADCSYNENLEALGKAALELAQQYELPSADVFHPMVAFQNAQKIQTPGFTMIPDSVHPSTAGHLVMAQEMLKGLGAEPMPPVGAIDLKSGTADGLRVVSNNPAQVVLETTRPLHLPFWFEAASLPIMRASGFLAMTAGQLTVKGLAAGYYKLTLDGADAGKYSAEELGAGITVTGNTFAPAQRLYDLIQRKEENYYTAWRQVRLPLADIPDSQQIVDGLMAADEGYQTVIHNLAAPLAKCTFTLSAAPEGPNLAQGKHYTCSDENKYNWGIGGLTDGNWEATPQHCFATGDAPALPKQVTIDLEKAAHIGTVIFGVPPFGSTKTVKVSVSADGQNFTEVGSHEFASRKEERTTLAFPATDARYVRLTYTDRYEEDIQFPRVFAFTTEVEVYATAK
jgi:lysophospholipase L1-like esterase